MMMPIEDAAEEEYLDDPIQLIPDPDVMTSRPEPQEFSAYKQKSYVPVTFFNINRNIKLLSSCRPLCIKLVDCGQFPRYYKKFNKKYSDISDSSDDKNAIYDKDVEKMSESLSIEAENLLNRVTSNALPEKLKNNKTETKKIENDVDFKKNKGLIGMKIAPMFEVIEIDDDSDETQSGNSSKDNKSSGVVISEVNEKIGDAISDLNEKAGDIISKLNEMPSDVISVIIEKPDDVAHKFDWNIQSSKNKDVEIGLSIETGLVNETIKTFKEKVTHNNLSFDLSNMKNNNTVILDKKEYSNKHNQEAKCESAVMSNIDNITYSEKNTMAFKDTYNTTRKEGNKEKLFDKSIKGKETLHETAIESAKKSTELLNIDDVKRTSCGAKKVTESESIIETVDCSLSPVFPCTSPKKIKKYNCNKPDTSKLEISQPKDFTDNKFKPNRLSSPKSTFKASAENIQENIKTIKNITTVDSKTNVQTKNKEKIIKLNLADTEKIYIDVINKVIDRKKVEDNFRSEVQAVQQVHSDNITTHTPCQLPALSGQKVIPDLKSTNAAATTLETQINKEQVIKLRLDKTIHKDMEKQQNLKHNICSEIQRMKGDDTMLKVTSQADKTQQFRAKKIDSLDQTYSEKSSSHHPRAAEKRPHVSHSVDTILHQSNLESTSMSEAKRINKFSELARQKNYSQTLSPAPAPKNIFTSHSALENRTTDANTRNHITHSGHKESSLRNDSITLESSGTIADCLKKSNDYGNHEPNNVVQNFHHIYEQKSRNLSENVIPGYLRQECCIPPYQQRQVIRPMMKPDGTPILSVRNYNTRHNMYNNMNNNFLPMNPYPGRYNINYNSYWNYQYTRMPPPLIPPPPQNFRRVNPNILRPQGKGNISNKNKVAVIKQVIVARPATENSQINNDFPDRSNPMNINLNNANPVKHSVSIGVNKSPRDVINKTAMFEELEKEMMNIHHEDSEHFINKDLCDNGMDEKYSNLKKCDPRKQTNFNTTHNTGLLDITANGQSTNKTNKNDSNFHKEGHDKTKYSKKHAKKVLVKRPSVELISKDSAKKTKNVISKAEKIGKPVNETKHSGPGYSPPILPIPSFKQTLDIIMRANNDAQKRLEALEKSYKKSSMNENTTKENNSTLEKDRVETISLDECNTTKENNSILKKDTVKKISLDEYKKRDKRELDRKKQEHGRRKKEKKAEKVRKMMEAKNCDQDQGYDSDSTIVINI